MVQLFYGKLISELWSIICHMRVIPKLSGLDILDNIFYNLYISETYILYEL